MSDDSLIPAIFPIIMIMVMLMITFFIFSALPPIDFTIHQDDGTVIHQSIQLTPQLFFNFIYNNIFGNGSAANDPIDKVLSTFGVDRFVGFGFAMVTVLIVIVAIIALLMPLFGGFHDHGIETKHIDIDPVKKTWTTSSPGADPKNIQFRIVNPDIPQDPDFNINPRDGKTNTMKHDRTNAHGY